MIRILAIGKKHEAWIEASITRYQTRLRAPWDVQWELLPHSSRDGDQARQEESERLLARIESDEYVILLDETGILRDSPTLATYLDRLFTESRSIVVIIGGAYGVDDQLMNRANLTLSLSPLVFPHQLVRLILIEQLYRAQEITRGSGYHHT